MNKVEAILRANVSGIGKRRDVGHLAMKLTAIAIAQREGSKLNAEIISEMTLLNKVHTARTVTELVNQGLIKRTKRVRDGSVYTVNQQVWEAKA